MITKGRGGALLPVEANPDEVSGNHVCLSLNMYPFVPRLWTVKDGRKRTDPCGDACAPTAQTCRTVTLCTFASDFCLDWAFSLFSGFVLLRKQAAVPFLLSAYRLDQPVQISHFGPCGRHCMFIFYFGDFYSHLYEFLPFPSLGFGVLFLMDLGGYCCRDRLPPNKREDRGLVQEALGVQGEYREGAGKAGLGSGGLGCRLTKDVSQSQRVKHWGWDDLWDKVHFAESVFITVASLITGRNTQPGLYSP